MDVRIEKNESIWKWDFVDILFRCMTQLHYPVTLFKEHLFNQAATAPLPRRAACLGICGHIELQSMRVVGNGAVELTQ